MYKNQLQELAQRSCFNLPSYTCIREGPDHAPRFRATVNFNGEIFESPAFCSTLRQAEHASAEVALNVLSRRGPSRSLAAKVLDETGVYKNLLQETAHRAGLELPIYTTIKSGPCHTPVFTSIVELAGLSFTGDPSKTKKQAQKNAAMAAWSALKQLPHLNPSSSPSLLEQQGHEEQGQAIIVHAPSNLWQPELSRQSSRNNTMDGRCRLSPMQRAMHPTSDVSSHSRPIQNRTYPNFSSKTDRYQMYQQTQASQQQSKMSIRPASSNSVDPRVLPVIQSIYQPTQEHFFQTIDQDPANGKENERLKFSFNAEVYSQSDISDTSPLLDSGRIVAIQELAEVQEKKCLSGQQEANITGTSSDSHSLAVQDLADAAATKGRQPVRHFQTRSFEWTSGASVEPEPLKTSHHLSSKQKVNSLNINTNPEVHDLPPSSTLASSRGLGHHVMQTPLTATSVSSSNRSVSGFQPLRPWMMSIAAPVTIRTAIPVCSGRPVNPDTRESWSSCIAPAAHVRHVISVRQPELNQMCKKEKGAMPEVKSD